MKGIKKVGKKVKKEEKKKEDVHINEEQLDKIETEIKTTKGNKKIKTKKETKSIYKKILVNIIIAMLMIIYFILLTVGANKISSIDYIFDLKTFAMIHLFVTILLFEIAYNKDDFTFAMYAIEMGVVGGLTIYLIDIFVRKTDLVNTYIAGCVFLAVIYYLIKIAVIRIRSPKEEQTSEQ